MHLPLFRPDAIRHLFAAAIILALAIVPCLANEDTAALETLDRQYLAALERLPDDVEGVAEERAWVKAGAAGEAPESQGKIAELHAVYIAERSKLLTGTEEDVAPTEWPTSVAIDLDFPVDIVKEDPENNVFIYRTPHFEFKADSQLRTNLVRGFSRIFEATLEAVHALPLPLAAPVPEGGFPTELYTNEADYFLAGGAPGSGGVFISRGGIGKIMIPLENLGVKVVGKGYSFDSRAMNSTLKHELAHQIVGAGGVRYPTWYSEGFAEYIAGAKYRNGRYTFTGMGDAMRDYLSERKGVWDSEHLAESVEDMMNISGTAWLERLASGDGTNCYATVAMMAMFFHEWDEGGGTHLRNYLLALKEGNEEPAARSEHLLRGRSYEQLQDDIAKGWRGEGLKLEFKAPSTG